MAIAALGKIDTQQAEVSGFPITTTTYYPGAVHLNDVPLLTDYASLVDKVYAAAGIADFQGDVSRSLGISHDGESYVLPPECSIIVSSLGLEVLGGIIAESHHALEKAYTGRVTRIAEYNGYNGSRTEFIERIERLAANPNATNINQLALRKLCRYVEKEELTYNPDRIIEMSQENGTEAARFTRRDGLSGKILAGARIISRGLLQGSAKFGQVVREQGNHLICMTSPELALNFIKYVDFGLQWEMLIEPVDSSRIDYSKIEPISKNYFTTPRVAIIATPK